jgi:hypothetical protein
VRTFQKILPGTACLFLNGACGDVNPVWIEQDFAEVERVGAIVGSAAARLAHELRPLGRVQRAWNIRWDELTEKPVTAGTLVGEPCLRVASRHVELPLRSLMPLEEYGARISDLQGHVQAIASDAPPPRRRELMRHLTRLRTERMLAERSVELSETRQALHPEIMAVGLGPDLAILGLPGEFFVETAQAIEEQSGVGHLLFGCYANHYVGYVCPPQVYEEGGYEAGVTLFAPEAEGIIKREAVAILGEVTSTV